MIKKYNSCWETFLLKKRLVKKDLSLTIINNNK